MTNLEKKFREYLNDEEERFESSESDNQDNTYGYNYVRFDIYLEYGNVTYEFKEQYNVLYEYPTKLNVLYDMYYGASLYEECIHNDEIETMNSFGGIFGNGSGLGTVLQHYKRCKEYYEVIHQMFTPYELEIMRTVLEEKGLL